MSDETRDCEKQEKCSDGLCNYCMADAGSAMWDCHHSDKPDQEDAMPCLCLCHEEAK